MGTVTTKDGTEIFFKDWGTGEPIFFHHGWPLSADDWDAQMMFFLGKGYCDLRMLIAAATAARPRLLSVTTWTPTRMTLKIVVKKLDLKDAVHVGQYQQAEKAKSHAMSPGTARVGVKRPS